MSWDRIGWTAAVASSIALLLAAGMFFVALGAKSDASRALKNARALHEAQLDVARAQESLGGADLDDANDAAAAANRTALRVGEVTRRMVDRLTKLRKTVERITTTAEEGSQRAGFARRQTEVAGDLLASIGGYQAAAARLARVTNRALERVLAALRRTNEGFPPAGGP